MIRFNSARHVRTLGFIAAASLLLAAFAACGPATSTSTNTAPIKIGFTVSLTGDFSADGKAIQQGYQLWADTINAHGGRARAQSEPCNITHARHAQRRR